MISSRMGPTDTLATRPARRLSISVRICGLPVSNIRTSVDFSRFSFNESKSRWLHSGTLIDSVNDHKYILGGHDELQHLHDIAKLRSASTSSLSLLSQVLRITGDHCAGTQVSLVSFLFLLAVSY